MAIVPAVPSLGKAAPTLCIDIPTGTTDHTTGPNGMRWKTKPPLVSSPLAWIVQARAGVRGILMLCHPPRKMSKTLLVDRETPAAVGSPPPEDDVVVHVTEEELNSFKI